MKKQWERTNEPPRPEGRGIASTANRKQEAMRKK
jgi:hypothetical protein